MEVLKNPFSSFWKNEKNGSWHFCLFLLDYIGSLKLIFVKAKNFCSENSQTENFSAAKHLLILEKAADGLSLADQVSFAV